MLWEQRFFSPKEKVCQSAPRVRLTMNSWDSHGCNLRDKVDTGCQALLHHCPEGEETAPFIAPHDPDFDTASPETGFQSGAGRKQCKVTLL